MNRNEQANIKFLNRADPAGRPMVAVESPYNPEVIGVCKRLGGKWAAGWRQWLVPLERASELKAGLEAAGCVIDLGDWSQAQAGKALAAIKAEQAEATATEATATEAGAPTAEFMAAPLKFRTPAGFEAERAVIQRISPDKVAIRFGFPSAVGRRQWNDFRNQMGPTAWLPESKVWIWETKKDRKLAVDNLKHFGGFGCVEVIENPAVSWE